MACTYTISYTSTPNLNPTSNNLLGKMFSRPATLISQIFKMHFYVVLSRIIVTELSLVAYHLASREFSETGLFDPSYKGEETRIPS